MISITEMSEVLQQVFEVESNEIAQRGSFIQRERKISGASFAQALVFGWLGNPEASLSELSRSFANVGVNITRQGVQQRFTPEAADFLKEVLETCVSKVIHAAPVDQGILKRFSHVYLMDSTQIELPAALAEEWTGCGGFAAGGQSAALKVGVKWDMRCGGLVQVELQDGKTHDGQTALQHTPCPKASLRIGDLGFFNLKVLAEIAAEGAYWLTRYKTGTSIQDLAGNKLDLTAILPQDVGQQLDYPVLLGKTAQLPCRLVAARAPAEVVEQRRERLQETARRRQEPIRQQAWDLAAWTIYLTNATPDLLELEAVLVLGRYRWQIELLFKLWKTELQLDQWRSQDPWRILCELYAKLIAALVQHWLLLLGCWDDLQRSLSTAAIAVRRHAWGLAAALLVPQVLPFTLSCICQAMTAARMEASSTKPRSFQLLEQCAA